MSAKYPIQFGLIALLAAYGGAFAVDTWWFRAVFLLIALSFGIVALAYMFRQPSWLLKRPDGSRGVFAWALLWPYYLLARLSLKAYLLTHRNAEPAAELAPGLWFSRWLTPVELKRFSRPPAILDLAAELPRSNPSVPVYRSLPWLDGRTPTQQDLLTATNWISENLAHGPVLVHCALGHGRTGSAVLAWLATIGQLSSVGETVQRLRALRPTFSLSQGQLSQVERFNASRAAR
jgi:hypothetical protein